MPISKNSKTQKQRANLRKRKISEFHQQFRNSLNSRFKANVTAPAEPILETQETEIIIHDNQQEEETPQSQA